MAKEGEDDGDLPIVNFEAISEDEIAANTGDENDADLRHGGPGTGPAQSGGGGPTSVGDLCIVSLILSSLL
jgi:hypothetical protein